MMQRIGSVFLISFRFTRKSWDHGAQSLHARRAMNRLAVNASAARRLFHVLQPLRRLFGPCLPRGRRTAGQRKGGRNRPLFPQKRLQRLQEPSGRGDAFLHPGLGTTLLAAERTGRICRGIELDPLYVDKAVADEGLMVVSDCRSLRGDIVFRPVLVRQSAAAKIPFQTRTGQVDRTGARVPELEEASPRALGPAIRASAALSVGLGRITVSHFRESGRLDCLSQPPLAGGVTSVPTTPGGSTAKPPVICAIPAAAHPK